MKRHLAMLAVGGICLPLTYHANRSGEWIISALVIAISAAVGYFIATRLGSLRLLVSVGNFALGALAAEVAFYLYYYLTYGHSDPSLTVGQAVAVVELLFIAAIGALGIVTMATAMRRITMRSSGP